MAAHLARCADARSAENIEPWRSGYRLLTGRILLRRNQPQVAGEYSRYIANHWLGSDHNEAVDLWNSVPPEKRGGGPALVMEVPEGTQMQRGIIVEVTCSTAPDGPYTAKLQPDSPTGASVLTLTAKGGLRRRLHGHAMVRRRPLLPLPPPRRAVRRRPVQARWLRRRHAR